MISIRENIFFLNEKIFWSAEIIFPVDQKMISMLANIFCISPIKVSDTKKIIGATQKHF